MREANKNNIQQFLRHHLCCPICKSELKSIINGYECVQTHQFPCIHHRPILIDEAQSVFRHNDYTQHKPLYFTSHTPYSYQDSNSISAHISRSNYTHLSHLLHQRTTNPFILIIGGSILGAGLNQIISDPSLCFIETDVLLSERVHVVCDAHTLPFKEHSFDAIIAQAVLEHVVDPYRCVQEIYRVLKPSGLVYAETPFLQQVHGGVHDFTRFTHRGHRRLFNQFKELQSGPTAGPATVLDWSYRYFMDALSSTPIVNKCLNGFAKATAFWLKYLDSYLLKKPGINDSSSGFYFLGEKSTNTIPDRDLLFNYP